MPENPLKSANQPTQAEKDAKKHTTGLKALNLAVEFGFIIVIPLLVFVYLGKWLDNRYDKGFFVILGILLALITTCLWFIKTIRKLMKDMEIK